MADRRTVALALLLGAALSGTPASVLAASVPQTVTSGVDATNHHYRSRLDRVLPVVRGVSWSVLDYNDEIELVNRSREVVTVFGYSGEPYLRILPGGSVELNEHSPAYYENQTFYANPNAVPRNARAGATPDWVTVAKTGTFVWHDHRIHYTSPVIPPVVQNRGVDRTTLVFKWTVPIEVGAARGSLDGRLIWIGEKPFSFPIGAIVAFVAIVLAGGAFVVVVRRRRARAASPGDGPGSDLW
jgi:hypothetical protein